MVRFAYKYLTAYFQEDGATKKEVNASEMRRRKLLAELRRKLKRSNKEESDTDEETSDDEILAPEKKSKAMFGNKLGANWLQ